MFYLEWCIIVLNALCRWFSNVLNQVTPRSKPSTFSLTSHQVDKNTQEKLMCGCVLCWSNFYSMSTEIYWHAPEELCVHVVLIVSFLNEMIIIISQWNLFYLSTICYNNRISIDRFYFSAEISGDIQGYVFHSLRTTALWYGNGIIHFFYYFILAML